MLVTFRTKAHADITMFGDVAVELLKLTGHSGTVPSAILARDIPGVLMRLNAALAQLRRTQPVQPAASTDGDPEAEPTVPLGRRALPLLELLRAAGAAGADVMILASR